ncbi:gluconokinase [Mesorhizobium sp. KR9-304]|uniref:gluconokinase n=1 Tax=Mesorhizobium sp. KR9-304 TaxID=3156614 RepID=UPI0032B4C79A
MHPETASPEAKRFIVVVMGVSGSGKTVIGSALAEALAGRFAEGDRFHPPENIARMSAGMPLRDEDRWGWLDAIAVEISEAERRGETLVIACSALKRIYRDRLRLASRNLRFVYLKVARNVAAARVAARKGHFMPASLIDSQFADLEPPLPDEDALTLDAARDPVGQVAFAASAILGSAPVVRA